MKIMREFVVHEIETDHDYMPIDLCSPENEESTIQYTSVKMMALKKDVTQYIQLRFPFREAPFKYGELVKVTFETD